MDNVTSSIVREDCEIEPVNNWFNNRITKWNKNRLARKVRFWIPNGRINLGRPKMRWTDQLSRKTEGMQQAIEFNGKNKQKTNFCGTSCATLPSLQNDVFTHLLPAGPHLCPQIM
jgi:hypothetical protein